MLWKILVIFTVCTIVNVVLNTMKSILTVKGGKLSAAIINALTFGFYTYIVILTANDEIATWLKMVITAVCNFIGVYIVKLIEEKATKDKLWKIELTCPKDSWEHLAEMFMKSDISFNYLDNVGPWVIFNVYSKSKEESTQVLEAAKQHGAKAFASENRY